MNVMVCYCVCTLVCVGIDKCLYKYPVGSVIAGCKRRRSRSAVSIMARSQSRGRSADRSGVRDPAMLEVAVKKQRLSERPLGRQGKQGVWDRHVYTKKPKHLFSGKRGIGKTQRR